MNFFSKKYNFTYVLFLIFILISMIYVIFWFIDKESTNETLVYYQKFHGNSSPESIKGIQEELIYSEKKFSNDILKIKMCEYYNEIKNKKINCKEISSKFFKELNLSSIDRKNIREYLNSLNIDFMKKAFNKKNELNIFKILGFYKTLIACVDSKKCKSNTAMKYFSTPMLQFVNTYCIYFESEANNWNIDAADNILVVFLLKNGISLEQYKAHDKNRERIFRCDNHRQIEEELNNY